MGAENEGVQDGKGRFVAQLNVALDTLTDYPRIERAGQLLATESA